MRSIFFTLITICIAAMACKKNNNPPVPAPPEETKFVNLRLRLGGDLLTSETALPSGRLAGNANTARALRDSTLYAVIVYPGTTHYPVYASGLFNHASAISLELPVERQFTISVRAFRKGTGGGMFYTWPTRPPYFPYFDAPTWASMNNRIDTAARQMYDTLSWIPVTNLLDTMSVVTGHELPELDAFYGSTTLTVTPAPVSAPITMKRLAFGVQLSSPNFTEGKLILTIPGAQTKTVTPADIGTQYFIFGADHFKWTDQFAANVSVKWQKADGTIVPLGEKSITFKRNVLTKVQVTISDTGRSDLNPVITETDWKGTETVDF